MQILLSIAMFLLMVSVGMSLRITEVLANWRRHRWGTWLYLLAATFLIPPALALIVARFVSPYAGRDGRVVPGGSGTRRTAADAEHGEKRI